MDHGELGDVFGVDDADELIVVHHGECGEVGLAHALEGVVEWGVGVGGLRDGLGDLCDRYGWALVGEGFDEVLLEEHGDGAGVVDDGEVLL